MTGGLCTGGDALLGTCVCPGGVRMTKSCCLTGGFAGVSAIVSCA